MENEKRKLEKYQKRRNQEANQDYSNIRQPEMRFKPRTDLERIVESLNSHRFNKNNLEVLDAQLKALYLNVPKIKEPKKNQMEEYGQESNRVNFLKQIEENNKKHKTIDIKNINHDDISVVSHASNKGKRKIDNKEARKILEDLHHKTHFKAAAMLTVDKSRVVSRVQKKGRNA